MMLLEVAQSSWLDQDRSHSLEMSKLAEEQNRHVKAEKWPWSDLSEITNCMANWSNRQKFEVRLFLGAFNPGAAGAGDLRGLQAVTKT